MGKSVLHVLAKRSTPDFGMRDKEREKRKKILKMCVQKLRDIDDPETVLCRAVLINNTFKTLKYSYRRVVKPEPEPVYTEPVTSMDDSDDNTEEEEDHDDDVSSDESSNSDDESMATSSSDNDSDDNDSQLSEPEIVHNKQESTYCTDELDNYTDTGCDLKNFNAESIVHSLMMPPLLSPQIEDMTNCSFYDNFATDQSGAASHSEPHNINHIKNDNESYCHTSHHPVDNVTQADVSGSFKFSVVTDDVNDDSTSNHVPLPPLPVHNNFTTSTDLDYCPKSSFPTTCVQSDIGNSLNMIDNLLTEIVQA